jgi:SpoVK/Ycf46/Vps4 family AAA+-type ATPase
MLCVPTPPPASSAVQARSLAPCCVLLDDIDAIAQRRAGRLLKREKQSATDEERRGDNDRERVNAGGAAHGSAHLHSNIFSGHVDRLPRPTAPVSVLDRMLATLLNELDGVGHRATDGGSNESLRSALESYVLVIGTTNRPLGLLDEAILRAGRLELHVVVPPPDAPCRLALLRHKTAPLRLAPGVSLDDLSASFDGFSAADIVYACDAAALAALQEAMEKDGADGMSPLLADMLGGHRLQTPAAAPRDATERPLSSASVVPAVHQRHFLEALKQLR